MQCHYENVIAIRKVAMGTLYTVFFPAAPEGGLVDVQDLGRLLEGSCRSEDTPNVLFFELFEGDGVASPRAGIGRGKVGRQMLRADPLAKTEDDGSLDDIAQFPDVSRPWILQEQADRIVGEADERTVVSPGVEGQQPRGESAKIFRTLAKGGISIWMTLRR